MDILSQPDPRINEIIALAQEDGRPLALQPETIVFLEDEGYIADPFTGQLWRDPAANTQRSLAVLERLADHLDRLSARYQNYDGEEVAYLRVGLLQ